jgi:Ankyrin repeat
MLLEHWQRLTEMISKSRVDVLKAFWEKEGQKLGGQSGIDVRVPELVPTTAGQTMLHIASEAGQEEIVRWLLEERKADPTIDVSLNSNLRAIEEDGVEDERKKGKTAYEVASSREVRNVFRRCAGDYPNWWDWLGAGRVPSVLNQQMEEQREEKKKVRRKGLKDKIKERESKTIDLPAEESQPAKEEVAPKKEVNVTGPRRLGGSGGDSGSIAGLTPEMRARVERERRARAAEARIKTLAG